MNDTERLADWLYFSPRDDMTDEEYDDAGAFYYGLGNDSPYAWGYDVNLELDIPPKYR